MVLSKVTQQPFTCAKSLVGTLKMREKYVHNEDTRMQTIKTPECRH